MFDNKCMIWNDKSKYYQLYFEYRWFEITINVNEQFFFTIFATHDIKVDFFVVIVFFEFHCIFKIVQKQIKKLKFKIKTNDDFVFDTKIDEFNFENKKIAKIKTIVEILKNVKQISKKRKINENDVNFSNFAFEKKQKSNKNVINDQKLNVVVDIDDNEFAKRILTVKRKTKKKFETEKNDDDRVVIKTKKMFEIEKNIEYFD